MNLSISRVLSEALLELRDNGRTLIAALWIPAVAIAVLSVWQMRQPPGAAANFLLFLPQFFLYALFAVTCHRVILLGRDRLPNALGVYASKAVWQYTGWIVVFTVIGIVAGMLLAFFLAPIVSLVDPQASRIAGWGIGFALGLLAIAAASRIILLFPALAVEDGRSLEEILDLSKPTWPRLAMLIFLSSVLTGLISWPLNAMMRASASDLAAVIPVFLSTLVGAYGVAVISCAYRAHVPQSDSEDSLPEPT